MQFKELEIPAMGNGWLPTYFDNRSFKQYWPSNKTITFTPRLNKPHSYWLNGGVTNVAVNVGTRFTNFETSGMFINNASFIAEYANGQLGGKHLSNFSQAECNNAVDSFLNPLGGGVKILTSGAAECTSSAINQCQLYAVAPQQYDWIDKRFAEKCAEKGGAYYGNYDGFIQLIAQTGDYTNVDVLRPSFNNNTTAYNYLKSQNTDNGFMSRDMHQFRHGIVQTYWLGWGGYVMLSKFMIQMVLGKKALIGSGSTDKRLMNFMWPAKNQFYDQVHYWKHIVPSTGGNYHNNWVGDYAPVNNYLLTLFSFTLGLDDVYCWEDAITYGDNPNIIGQDVIGSDGHIYSRYEGPGNPQRAAINYDYHPEVQAAYPSTDETSWDYIALACEHYGKLQTWAGQNFQFVKHRKITNGTPGAWCSEGNEYLLDRHVDKKPWAQVNSQGDRRGLIFYDAGSLAGTVSTYEVDVLGSTFTISAMAGHPYTIAIDLAA